MQVKVYPATDPRTWPMPDDAVNPSIYLLGTDSKGVTGQSLHAQKAAQAFCDQQLAMPEPKRLSKQKRR